MLFAYEIKLTVTLGIQNSTNWVFLITLFSSSLLPKMFVVFTLMVEDIFLVTKRKLHFCKTLNRKSISTSAVSPSAEYLAMVLVMFWVFFIDSCKGILFILLFLHAVDGEPLVQTNNRYRLKGHRMIMD